MHPNSIKLKTFCAVALVGAMQQGSAAELQDNRAYAILQECLAGAELPANLGSGLDRYCIESYLATQGDIPRYSERRP